MYRPSRPLRVAFELLVPTKKRVKGVDIKEYPSPGNEENPVFFGSYVTFGGSDRVVNGMTVAYDTGSVECWFDPRIRSDCRLYNRETKTFHDIIGQVENIESRGMYMKFRVEAVKGGA
jgi:hypothetical protein